METMLHVRETETTTRTEDPLAGLLARPARISETVPRTGKFFVFGRDEGTASLNRKRGKDFPEILVTKKNAEDMGVYVYGVSLVGEVKVNSHNHSETDGEISVQLSPGGEFTPLSEEMFAPIAVIRMMMLLDCGCL